MKRTGFAVMVYRRYERPNGSLTDGHPINFWHHPCNKAIRLHHKDEGYDGVPMVQPLNSKWRPPLVFETMAEAEVAAEFFNSLWGEGADQGEWRDDVFPGEYVGQAQAVKAAPNVRLSDNGFQPITPADSLFASLAS